MMEADQKGRGRQRGPEEGNIGTYGRFAEAAKYIDPRHE